MPVVLPGEGAPPAQTDARQAREHGRRLPGAVLALLVAGVVAAAFLLLTPWGDGDRDADRDTAQGASPSSTPVGATTAATNAGSNPSRAQSSPTAARPTSPTAARPTSPTAAGGAVAPTTAGTSPASPTSTSQGRRPGTRAPARSVPAGYVLHRDRTGFVIAVPSGWTLERPYGSAVRFNDPASSASLLIDQTDKPKNNAVADWKSQEGRVRGNYTDYQRVGKITGFELRGWEGADWEWTYAVQGGRGHRLNRNLITTPGEQAYALLWTTPDSQWSAMRDDFDLIFTSFRPRG